MNLETPAIAWYRDLSITILPEREAIGDIGLMKEEIITVILIIIEELILTPLLEETVDIPIIMLITIILPTSIISLFGLIIITLSQW